MRTCKCIAVIGQNGTGKTHFIQNELLPKRKNGIILTPGGDQSWSKKINELNGTTNANCEISTTDIAHDLTGFHIVPMFRRKKYLETVFKSIFSRYHNGYVILDDSNLFLPSNIDNIGFLHEILGRRRQIMCDIIITAHSFRDYNPGFISYTSDLVLFKTSDSPVIRKKEFGDNLTGVIEASRLVDREYKKNKYYKTLVKFR